MISRVLLWIRAARVPFFTGSVMPVCVCSAMAWYETGRFHWGYWLVTVVSMMLIHAGANLANDYFDHLSGNDPANTEFVNPFTGGSRVIQDLEVWPLDVLWAALLCLGAGSLLGLYLVYARGLWILAIGLVGVISAFCYSGPPLRLGYRGVGELFIFLDFGILPALGAYYVQAQTFSWGAIAAGLPNALLITAVLFINQFQDMRADMVADKRHWVVRLGRKRARWYYYALVTAAPLCVIGGVILGWLPTTAMIGVGGGVLLPGMIWTAGRYYDEPAELAPANASTIVMHLLTGVLLTVGILLGGTA